MEWFEIRALAVVFLVMTYYLGWYTGREDLLKEADEKEKVGADE